jgi:FkbM family methyltransferase
MTTADRKTQETSQGASPDANSFVSYSLNFEDVVLHRLFPVTKNGFYVDVGAGHPRFENDTFSFYLRGWRGINIEPNHEFHRALMEERPRDINLQVVLSDGLGGTLTYYELNGSGLSTCDAEQAAVYQAAGRDIVIREVPVRTLSGVLTEAAVVEINILKVDVEGFEEKVLNGNDWNKFRPEVVVVEATYPERPVRRPTGIPSFMEQLGYHHVHFDGLNDFYLEHEFSAPEGLTLPPNVFDRFVPREIVDLRGRAESLQTNFTAAEEYASSLQSQLSEALRAADSLAVENRRVGHQSAHLASENRRLREAAEQMRAELMVLNRLLEPLHAIGEQLERQRQHHEKELAFVKNELLRERSVSLAESEARGEDLRNRLRQQLKATQRLSRLLEEAAQAAVRLRSSARWQIANPIAALKAKLSPRKSRHLLGYGHLEKVLSTYDKWRASHPETAAIDEQIQDLISGANSTTPEKASAVEPPVPRARH